MARTKTATRQRPPPKRSQLVPVAQDPSSPSLETATTPTIAILNCTASPTRVASENDSPCPSLADTPSASETPGSQRKSRVKPRTKRTPFLASDLVGNRTRRIGIREPEKTNKTIMSFCVDCVRPHLWIYCDGTRELKTHLCEFHEKEPNPLHWTKYYNEIRKTFDYLFQDEKKGGKVWDRPFTVPKLKHRYKCGHDKKSLEGDFDKAEMVAMKKMRKIENKMASEEDNEGESDSDE